MDVSKSLQGKIAGVNVKQSSGMPGATSHVTIRGNVSLTGSNQPLYVVDGMPIASEKAFTELVGSGTNPSSRVVDLNPEDIESISVLKGATASALYGLRAANGVVLITTKSGSAAKNSGKSTLVTVNTNYTSDRISRLPDLQSTYAQGNGGYLGLLTSGSWGPRIDTLKIINPSTITSSWIIPTRHWTDHLHPMYLPFITTRKIFSRQVTPSPTRSTLHPRPIGLTITWDSGGPTRMGSSNRPA
jgi:TonB-dependent SusC/RagA subfamily outer membrane receptor